MAATYCRPRSKAPDCQDSDTLAPSRTTGFTSQPSLRASAPVSAFLLLLTYSIGLGIPFLIVGLFTSEATKFINKFGTASVLINKAFGVILIILGILVFTDNIRLLGSLESVMSLFH